MTIGMNPGIDDGSSARAVAIAVIDGPYDAAALSRVLAHAPVSLGHGACDVRPNSACDHGTFILGLLGARQDALIAGLCPDCRLIHIPLFTDVNSPSASVDELAAAIRQAVTAGARLINLSLAILGEDSEDHPRLAAALDLADMSGALLLVAAGNQGRLAMGQLLSHPVAIPVVGVDASQRLLPECNFGPAISRRGVAALGQMPGYAPGGGMTVMSGTSVATAVATATLAQVWSGHPEVDGARLRSIVASLGPRNGSKPPILDRDFILAALDQVAPTVVAAARPIEIKNYVSLQGGTTMTNGNGQPGPSHGASLIAKPARAVVPAGGGDECACGAPGGVCTCNGDQTGGFVYAIGTIEADYPNEAIEREMQILAYDMDIDVEPDRDLSAKPTEDRNWQHAVLTEDRKRTRYIARQLRWRLTIEDFPVFVLNPRDPSDLDELIDALARPKYPKLERRSGKRAAAAKSAAIEPPHPEDLDVVIGVTGPQTPDGIAVQVDQIFTIPTDQLPSGGLAFLSQLSDNHGLTDEDRAYNFLMARYKPPLMLDQGFELAGVAMAASRLGAGIGRIVRAIYTFRNMTTLAEKKQFLRVDVTHEFPIIVNPLQPYLERGERS